MSAKNCMKLLLLPVLRIHIRSFGILHFLIGDYAGARLELGYACALSLVMFAITFTLGKFVMKLLSSKDEL